MLYQGMQSTGLGSFVIFETRQQVGRVQHLSVLREGGGASVNDTYVRAHACLHARTHARKHARTHARTHPSRYAYKQAGMHTQTCINESRMNETCHICMSHVTYK